MATKIKTFFFRLVVTVTFIYNFDAETYNKVVWFYFFGSPKGFFKTLLCFSLFRFGFTEHFSMLKSHFLQGY